MTDDLNSLDTRIDTRAFFERVLKEREKLEEERIGRIVDRFDAVDKALELQAREYARRLSDLNGEYQRDRNRQGQYVTIDKWESTNEAESIARTAALLRVDEKFEDYVLRYEQRQREIDMLLSAQKGAAEEAKRAAEQTGRNANRNLGIASLGLGVVVFVASILPVLIR